MSTRGRAFLLLAGAASTGIALLHVVIIAIGAPGYRYFGAGEEIARRAEAGSLLPAALTAVITLVFLLFAAYALAGAGLLPRPPLLRPGLVAISIVFLLRGFFTLPHAAALASGSGAFPPRYFVFSLIALLVGLSYTLGTRIGWERLGPPGG